MHKGVILLVKATNREEATDQANEFMEGYQNEIWDWFVIGGRWSGTLNTLNNQFMVEADKILRKDDKDYVTTKDVEDNKQVLQDLWASMGGTGHNPYSRDAYNQDGNTDDIVPLSDCLEIVKEWVQDSEAESTRVLEEGKKNWPNDKHMQGYFMKRAGELLAEYFCFDTNVYNVNDGSYKLPKGEDIKDFFAVMIDMHN